MSNRSDQAAQAVIPVSDLARAHAAKVRSDAAQKDDHREGPTFSLAEVEAMLVEVHFIQPVRRSPFNARLKNLMRLGFPRDAVTSKGRTTQFSAYQVLQLALAIELTQLGLSPERVVRVLDANPYPVGYAVYAAANYLLHTAGEKADERHTEESASASFLYFDPSVLNASDFPRGDTWNPWRSALGDIREWDARSFWHADQSQMRELLTSLTGNGVGRVSIINITTVLNLVFGRGLGDAQPTRKKAFHVEALRSIVEECLVIDEMWNFYIAPYEEWIEEHAPAASEEVRGRLIQIARTGWGLAVTQARIVEELQECLEINGADE